MDLTVRPSPAGLGPDVPTTDHPLAPFGWDGQRAADLVAMDEPGAVPGRVIATGGFTRAMTADGLVEVVIQRRFRRGADGAASLPAVGDWLALEPIVGGGRPQAALRAVLPRTSAFARGETVGDHVAEQVVAANVDHAFLVSALTHDLNPRRIERYLLLAWSSGARPVIVLNKADLTDDLPGAVAAVAEVAGDAPIHPVSAVTGTGMEALAAYLAPGATVCLLGSSGVGKSTLANALLGESRQEVRAERADDSRGRHTTTARELFPLPSGALLIDTPGLRSVGLWDDGSGLERAFSDVVALAEQCRFRDCRHETEPGCAVQSAIAEGELPEERLASHRKLEREIHALELRTNVAAARAENRRCGRMYRQVDKTARARMDG